MKRWTFFLLLQGVIILVAFTLINLHQDKVSLVKTPPKSLSKWYKPENKRQVWLHTMFALRREMQAVQYYAKNKDSELMKKWAGQFSEHYVKIEQMVPQWKSKLDKSALRNLQQGVEKKDYSQVLASITKLQGNCDSCHNDFQAITALTYRSADFSRLNLDENTDFKTHMQLLTKQVNQVKISAQDGHTDIALNTLKALNSEMDKLGEVCSSCHKGGKTYPSEQVKQSLVKLQTHIIDGDIKKQGMELGTVAVLACAQCHGTHRLAFGAKQQLSTERSWFDLIKHN